MKLPARYLLVFILASIASPELVGQTIAWQHTYGGSLHDRPQKILQVGNGYLMCGSSESSDGDVSVNKGNLDVWLVKINSSGTLLWEKTFGGSSLDGVSAMALTSDGGCIMAGNTFSTDIPGTTNRGAYDYYVIKVDSLGVLQWQKTLGGPLDDRAKDVKQTADGGYILTGMTNAAGGDVSNYHTGIGGDMWVVKLDDTGGIKWEKSLGGSMREEGTAVAQTNDQGFILSGYTLSSDGDVAIGYGKADGWLVKLDSLGSLQWEKTFSGATEEQFWGVQQTDDGGFVAVGGVEVGLDDDDFLVVKTDGNGVLQWTKHYGGSLDDFAYSIVQSSDRGYVMTGRTFSNDGDITSLYGASDVWVVKTNDTGGIVWQKSLGGSNAETGTSLILTSDSSLVFTGPTESNNWDVTKNQGDVDFWVVKLALPLGITSPGLKRSDIKVYPTISSGNINVEFPSDHSSYGHYQISSVLGLKIKTGKLVQRKTKIDVSNLSSGNYFIEVKTETGKQGFMFYLNR